MNCMHLEAPGEVVAAIRTVVDAVRGGKTVRPPAGK